MTTATTSKFAMTSISLCALVLALTSGQQILALEPAGLGSLNPIAGLHNRMTKPLGGAKNSLANAARLGAMQAVNQPMVGYPTGVEMSAGLGRPLAGSPSGALAAGVAGAAAAGAASAASAQTTGTSPIAAGTAAGTAAAVMGASTAAANVAASVASNQARVKNAAHLIGANTIAKGIMAADQAAAARGIHEAAATIGATSAANAIAAGAAASGAAASGANVANAASAVQAAGAAGAAAGAAAATAGAAAGAASAANDARATSQAVKGALVGANSVNPSLGRLALASDAINRAKTEAAIAGADMLAHGINNAKSASLAANAYREAKLASTRDQVDIAGTIQNSARISDAAIATHDAATKAEDSLLGSEIAIDSAGTVLDSDAAYIPPVTSSLLRTLPYGRLGIRNIVPRPLTYPSVLLPDVWLNGLPVNYLNVPLRAIPYGIAPAALNNQLGASAVRLAAGQLVTNQPFYANNGMLINELVMDPMGALLASGLPLSARSSLLPVLANGQLEAQDELARANMLNLQQLSGKGMAATYTGYGRMNPVPMLTGSVSAANLQPTTTIGTTYPIGSALVVEPRDSYFQDYIDSASSRQNFDERQQ